MFETDKEEFIDSQKFEKIVEIIPKQFDAIYLEKYVPQENFFVFSEEFLQKLIISLMELVNDDYKWKSLVYGLLLKTRSEEKSIKVGVLRVIEGVIEHFNERFVVLINDLLPFLNEMLDDLEPEVEKICKGIVMKLEKISGEDIRDYIKKL